MSTEMPWEEQGGSEGGWGGADGDKPQVPREPRATHRQRQEAQHGQGVAQVPLPGRRSVPQFWCGGDMAR